MRSGPFVVVKLGSAAGRPQASGDAFVPRPDACVTIAP